MDMYETIKTEENRKAMKQARESKPIRDRKYYLEDKFAENQEERDDLLCLRSNVKSVLEEVSVIDDMIKEKEDSKLDHALSIGKHARILKLKLKFINNKKKESRHKFSIQRYMSVHFNKDVRRINEYMAARRAYKIIKKAENETTYPLTHLVILGQALGAKDKEKRVMCTKALKTNKLPDNSIISEILSTKLAAQINSNLKIDSNHIIYYLSDIERSVKNLDSYIRSFEESINNFNKTKPQDKDELFTKSANLVEFAEKLLPRINQIREVVKMQIKSTGSGQSNKE